MKVERTLERSMKRDSEQNEKVWSGTTPDSYQQVVVTSINESDIVNSL